MSTTIRLYVLTLIVLGLPYVIRLSSPRNSTIPLVVLQILLGIALGPTLLGVVAPEVFQQAFDPEILSGLSGIASFAVILFGFVTGLRLNMTLKGRTAAGLVMVGAANVLIPLICGSLMGWWLGTEFPSAVGARADHLTFAIAIGVSVAVTALPVLAAILRETKLTEQRIGQTAIFLAAMTDAVLWVLLTFLLLYAQPEQAGGRFLQSVISIPVAFGAIFVGTRALNVLWRRLRLRPGFEDAFLAINCAFAFFAALATDLVGLHGLIGAFAAGVMMPSPCRRELAERIEQFCVVVLLPFFFVITGLRTRLELFDRSFIEMIVLMTLVASTSKILGTAVLARIAGERWRFAISLGALMQVKGLMEVIAAFILLNAQIISERSFSAMIVMAIVTTMGAVPIARLGLGRNLQEAFDSQESRVELAPPGK